MLRSVPARNPLSRNPDESSTRRQVYASPLSRANHLAACLAFPVTHLQVLDAHAAIAGLALVRPAPGVATIVVTSCSDDIDDASITQRTAVAMAGSGDTVDMSALTCSTITLQTGSIDIDALTLQGPGVDPLTISEPADKAIAMPDGFDTRAAMTPTTSPDLPGTSTQRACSVASIHPHHQSTRGES